MKRIAGILTVLVLTLAALCAAYAEQLTFKLTKDKKGYEIASCDPTATTVAIPAEHKGLPVVSIANKAFIACEKLTKFTVEKASRAFYAKGGVLFTNDPVKTLVRFPNAYEKQFYRVPKDVEAIAPYAFSGQHTLSYLHFQNGLKSLGNNAFDSVGSQIMVFVPDSLTKIGKNLMQNQQSNVPWYGSADCEAAKYANKYQIPYGVVSKHEPSKQTAKLAKLSVKNAKGLSLPDPEKVFTLEMSEYDEHEASYSNLIYYLTYRQTLAAHQEKGYSEIRIDLEEYWRKITPDADGKTQNGFDARTGLYGMGYTEAETVLRGYDPNGKVVGTRVVNGNFTFSLPGAYRLGVAGGKNTSVTITPYEPITFKSAGDYPLDPAALHYTPDGTASVCFLFPFAQATINFNFPQEINIFSYGFSDAMGDWPQGSPYYSMLTVSLNDPYLIKQCNLIALQFDYLRLIYENKGFSCSAAERYHLTEDYGKSLYQILKQVKSIMIGTYYPSKATVNPVTVLADGSYPSSYRSVIKVDDYLVPFKKSDTFSFAHEMTHAIDQSYDNINYPSAWLEGRAEYIGEKVCLKMKREYSPYPKQYDWSFISKEDRKDFFHYYYYSTNTYTTYPVGYYFFKYLCETYGEDVSAKITEKLIARGQDVYGEKAADVFKQCVTEATDLNVFQNFVRDVIEKKKK